jgi:hypothetical protein
MLIFDNLSFGVYAGMSITHAVKYHAVYLIEWYIQACSTYHHDEGEAIWAAIVATEPQTIVMWCPVCEHTKHHDNDGCLSCRGEYDGSRSIEQAISTGDDQEN